MTERINRKGDECLYQPRLHSTRIRALHLIAVDEQKPMTAILDGIVARGVKEYNGNMEKPQDTETLETQMDRLAGSVEYFSLQKYDGIWLLSFVSDDTHELEDESLSNLIAQASKIVFPASSEDHPEVEESSVPPSPENQ